ncbi:MAG TPA: hypothetical protein VET47_00060 [Candidatus Limnocylindrales bacterium]|nr:hypothetical protein [Candidatus Limnocylindrales bacterium]
MSTSQVVIGIGLAVAAIVVVALFTNIFDLARPGVEKAISSSENAASSVTVKGKDVVSEVKTVSSDVKNVTSQIKVKSPYP